MSGPTLYDLLGVAPTASTEEIREAYVLTARNLHPDVGGDGETMALVNEAWEILGNRDRRRTYDATLRRERRVEIRRPTSEGASDDLQASSSDLDDQGDPDAFDDDGRPLGGVVRLLTKVAPVLFAVGFVVANLGLILQIQALFAAGLVGSVAAVVLFVLMPFFAMSSRR